jgi:hypothetical protein
MTILSPCHCLIVQYLCDLYKNAKMFITKKIFSIGPNWLKKV